MDGSILVLEGRDDIGGLWHPEYGYTWHSMTTNLSKYTFAFSDFPWEKDVQMFPKTGQAFEYLKRYAKHFGLEKYISLSSRVESVERTGPEEKNDSRKNYTITWKKHKTG